MIFFANCKGCFVYVTNRVQGHGSSYTEDIKVTQSGKKLKTSSLCLHFLQPEALFIDFACHSSNSSELLN